MDKKVVSKLKTEFRKALRSGRKTAVGTYKFVGKNPGKSALFALLAANLIKMKSDSPRRKL